MYKLCIGLRRESPDREISAREREMLQGAAATLPWLTGEPIHRLLLPARACCCSLFIVSGISLSFGEKMQLPLGIHTYMHDCCCKETNASEFGSRHCYLSVILVAEHAFLQHHKRGFLFCGKTINKSISKKIKKGYVNYDFSYSLK